MRLRNNPRALKRLEEHPEIVVFKPQTFKGKWHEYFKNQNPIYVELGMGRGTFITTHASRNSNINYIGFELRKEVVNNALEKALALELKNIILLPENIDKIEDIFFPGEIDRFYINFCDPWPKARHAKRRLTHHLFLDRYKRILKSTGDILFKTDSKDLFDFSLDQMEKHGFEVSQVSYDLKAEKDPSNVATEYESKFMELGIPICRLKASPIL